MLNLFFLFVCFLANYECDRFLLLMALIAFMVILSANFLCCTSLRGGFGWMLIKEGASVEDKYQELFNGNIYNFNFF